MGNEGKGVGGVKMGLNGGGSGNEERERKCMYST